jgi:RHS repeat-associated protein
VSTEPGAFQTASPRSHAEQTASPTPTTTPETPPHAPTPAALRPPTPTTTTAHLHTATTDTNTTTYSYDAVGNLIQTDLPNGVTETSTFDRAGRQTARDDGFRTFGYAYDDAGNVTSRTIGSITTDYSYDDLDRLTGTDDGTNTTAYAYDNVGNRTTLTDNAGTHTYSYDDADQLETITDSNGTTAYAYDDNGNQTQSGPWTYTVNLASQITAGTDGTTSTSYTYDGDGNRLSQTTGATVTDYVWDTSSPVARLALERDGAGTTQRTYTYGNGRIAIVKPSAVGYYSTDMLGSVSELSDGSGNSLGEFSSGPFGEDVAATGVDPSIADNPFYFTGEYTDSVTGLVNLHARQYDPALGQFTSPDPLGAEGAAGTYVYVGDNPTTYIDPAGTRKALPRGCSTRCKQNNDEDLPEVEEERRHPNDLCEILEVVWIGNSVYEVWRCIDSETGEVYEFVDGPSRPSDHTGKSGGSGGVPKPKSGTTELCRIHPATCF